MILGSGLSVLPAGAAAALVAIAGSLRLAPQRFKLIPRLQFLALKRGENVLVILTVNEHGHLVAQRHHIDDLALAARRDDALVALGQLLPRRHILLVLIDEAAAQPSTHPGD